MKRDDVIARVQAEANARREAIREANKPPALSIIPRSSLDETVPYNLSQRRLEAMSLRAAGLSIDQIAERMETTSEAIFALLKKSETNPNRLETADEMRSVENDRRDLLSG